MSYIVNDAEFDDVWKYVSVRDIQKHFWQIRWRTPHPRERWKQVLTLMGYPPNECSDPIAARILASLRQALPTSPMRRDKSGLMFVFIRSGQATTCCFLTLSGEPEIKIDVAYDPPPHFGSVAIQTDGVRVDSLENLAVGKLLAVFGRAYPRDFVGLYFAQRRPRF